MSKKNILEALEGISDAISGGGSSGGSSGVFEYINCYVSDETGDAEFPEQLSFKPRDIINESGALNKIFIINNIEDDFVFECGPPLMTYLSFSDGSIVLTMLIADFTDPPVLYSAETLDSYFVRFDPDAQSSDPPPGGTGEILPGNIT